MANFRFDDDAQMSEQTSALPEQTHKAGRRVNFKFDDDAAGPRVEPTGPAGAFAGGLTRGSLETSSGYAGGAIGVAAGLATGPAAPVAVPVLGAAGAMIGSWIGSGAADSLVGEEDEDDLGAPAYHTGRVMGDVLGGIGTLPSIARRVQGRLPDNWAGRFLTGLVDEAARGLTVAKEIPANIAKKLPFLGSAVSVPSRFTIQESITGAGAGVGAAVAEATDPGDALSRMTGEVLGGLAVSQGTPTLIAAKLTGRLANFLKKQTTTGRKDIVAETLQGYVEAAGENPEKLLELLQSGRAGTELIADFQQLPGTASTLTDSPALMQLEADIGKNAPLFMAEVSEQRRKSMQALGRTISMLRGSGSPEALDLAVQLRFDMQEELVAGYLEGGQKKALEAARKVGKGLIDADGNVIPGKLQDVSKVAHDAVNEHFTKVREVEEGLWAKAFEGKENFTAVRKSMSAAYDDVLANRVASELDMPAKLKARMTEIRNAENTIRAANDPSIDVEIPEGVLAKAQDTLSVKRLMLTRTQLLGEVRQAVQKGDNNTAELLGRIVDGVTKDLHATGVSSRVDTLDLPGGGSRTVRRTEKGQFTGATPYDKALAFSKAFKDASARTFAGAVRKKDLEGTNLIQPELLLRRSLASGKELGDVRMRQIREFMKFSPEQLGMAADAGTIDSTEALANVVQAQTDMLRTAAYAAVGRDGKVSAANLRSFLTKHNDALADFPEVKADVEGALAGQEMLKRFEARAKNYTKKRNQAFARSLGYDSAAGALVAAFKNRRNPVASLDQIVKSAKRGGDEAMESLRHSVWDLVFHRAKADGGGFDIETVAQTLDAPISPGSPTLREYMLSNDLIRPDVADRLDGAIEYARRILTSQQMRPQGEVIAPPGILENMFVSVFGAEGAKRGFQAVQRMTGNTGTQNAAGPTLVLAQRGSNAARGWLIATPHAHMKVMLQDALSGASLTEGGAPYSLLEELLKPTSSARAAMAQIRKVNIYMWNAGMHSVQSIDGSLEDDIMSEQTSEEQP